MSQNQELATGCALLLCLLLGCHETTQQLDPKTCGNGQIDEGEICDDGPNNDGRYNGCTDFCTRGPFCGDGVVDPEQEQCDGALSDTEPNACRSNCRTAHCGDGVLDRGEVCDHGDNDGRYGGCTTTCTRAAFCGDGAVDPRFEQCDDGPLNTDSPGACRLSCRLPRCRDGIRDPGEICLGLPHAVPGPWFGKHADFNGDGITDLFLTTERYGIDPVQQEVRLGDGLGGFDTTDAFMGLPWTSYFDVDADGWIDLVQFVSPELTVRFGNGDGTFVTGIQLAEFQQQPWFLDVDQDGILDLVSRDDPMVVWKNVGGRSLERNQTLDPDVSSNRFDPFVGDFNGDGLDDLLVGGGTGSGYHVFALFLMGETGLFQEGQRVIDTEHWFGPLQILDLDRDGFLDLFGFEIGIVAYFGGEGGFERVRLGPVDAQYDRYSRIAVDFDEDGQVEIIAYRNDEEALVHLELEGRVAHPQWSYPLASSIGGSVRFHTQDVNEDNRLDLLVTNRSDPVGLGVFLGQADGFADPIWSDGYPDIGKLVDIDADGQMDLWSGNTGFAAGNGRGSFATEPVFRPEEGGGDRLLHADLDLDGTLEVVLASDDRALLLDTTETGLFFRHPSRVMMHRRPLAAADVNRDGWTDIIVNRGRLGRDQIDVFFGPFSQDPWSFDGVPTATSTPVLGADVDEDGYWDLLVGGEVYFGNGETYQKDGTLVSRHADTTVAADFNGDGRLDLASAAEQLRIFHGSRHGQFDEQPQLLLSEPRSLASADLNADSFLDLVALTTTNLSVFLGRSDGFNEAVESPHGSIDPANLHLHDLDGDGIIDAVFLARANNSVVTLHGNGDGTFAEAVWSGGVNQTLSDNSVWDIDQDGRPELLLLGSFGLATLHQQD